MYKSMYGKRSGYRKRYSGYRKRNYGVRKPSYYGVKKIIRKTLARTQELKTIDSVIGMNANTTGDQAHLNLCTQGDSMISRDGQRIFVKSIQMNLDVKAASSGVDQTVTVMLLRLKQNNGRSDSAAVNWTNTLASSSPLALRALSTQSQVQVLGKWIVDLNAIGESGSERIIKYYKKMNMPVYYNSTNGGTIADIDKNGLVLVVRGDEAAGTSAASVVGFTRIRFTD